MHREPFLIAGGCLLACGAAFINTGLLVQTGTSVSHLTGDLSRLAVDLSAWDPAMLSDALHVGIAALGFFTGALLAGFFVHHPSLDFSRPYGRSITSIGVLLGLAAFFALHRPELSIAAASIACGLQNALANHYRGIVLRTTHVTGMFTDLGVTAGMRLRGHHIPAWKIGVPLCLVIAFFSGGALAAWLHGRERPVIAIASAAYLSCGLLWSLAKRTILRAPASAGTPDS